MFYLCSLQVLAPGMSFLRSRVPGVFSSVVFCRAWGLAWYVAARLSVFLVVVLTMSRMWSIVWPLRRVSGRVVWGSVGLYCSYLNLQFIVYLLLEEVDVGYNPESCQCDITATKTSQSTLVAFEIAMVVSWVLPVLLVLTSCIVSIRALSRDATLSRDSAHLGRSRQRASTTIILFGVVYLLFNLPTALYILLQTIQYNSNTTLLAWDYQHYFMNLAYTGCVTLNAVVNPALYCWRMEGLRRFLADKDSGAPNLKMFYGYSRYNTLAGRVQPEHRTVTEL